MKAALAVLGTAGFLILGCSMPLHHTHLDRMVRFKAQVAKERIPLKVGVVPPSMPALPSDPELWTWFFREALGTVLKEVVVLKEVGEVRDVALVVRPELWTYMGVGVGVNRGNCVIGFRFHVHDPRGVERLAFILEGRNRTARAKVPFIGEGDYYNPFLAQAMDELVEKLRKEFQDRRGVLVEIR